LVTEELHNLKSWFSIPTIMKSVVSHSFFYSGNGYITTKTLREILSALDDKLGPEDLDGIIAEIDTDGSGTVDFDGEFFLAKHPQRMYFLGTEAQALYKK